MCVFTYMVASPDDFSCPQKYGCFSALVITIAHEPPTERLQAPLVCGLVGLKCSIRRGCVSFSGELCPRRP